MKHFNHFSSQYSSKNSSRYSLLSGVLPSYREGRLGLELDYDAEISCDYFIMNILRYDDDIDEAIERTSRICRALPITRTGENRALYLREMCTMVSSHISKDVTLSRFKKVFDCMNASWDFLSTFTAIDEVLAAHPIEHVPAPNEKTTITLEKQEMNTVLAALAYYYQSGMGDADKRPSSINAIAVGVLDSAFNSVSLNEPGVAALFDSLARHYGISPLIKLSA